MYSIFSDAEKIKPEEFKFESTQTMGNLATIKIFQTIKFSKFTKKYLFIADEYYRIKICRYPEIYEIISIWIPFECIARSMINFHRHILVLFKSEEEKPLNKYKLCSIEEKDIENQNFISFDLKIDLKFGERKNEKNRMFAINEENNEFTILSQFEKDNEIVIEINLYIFDEKESKIIDKGSITFRNKERVKITKITKNYLVLAGKTGSEAIETELKRKEILKNVEMFENNLISFFFVHLI